MFSTYTSTKLQPPRVMYGNLKLRLHHGNVTWLSVGGRRRLTSCSITTKEEELRLPARPRRRSYTCITSVFNFCHILFLSPASSHTLCVCVCLHVCVSSFLATQITCNMNRFMVGPQSHDLQTSEQPLAVRETCSQS